MLSSQLDSYNTEDVRVNDKIACVGVKQHCTLTRMQKKPVSSTSYYFSVEKYLH